MSSLLGPKNVHGVISKLRTLRSLQQKVAAYQTEALQNSNSVTFLSYLYISDLSVNNRQKKSGKSRL